jgi:hypothetical protein
MDKIKHIKDIDESTKQVKEHEPKNYYYDDGTGYEVYDPDEEEDDEELEIEDEDLK